MNTYTGFVLQGKESDYIKSYFTGDGKWAVLKNKDSVLYLYKADTNRIYIYTEFQSNCWGEIEKYVKELI